MPTAGKPSCMREGKPPLRALLIEAVRRLFTDEAIPLAGNIAFRILFSLFPFLIFLTALAGFFGSDDLAALERAGKLDGLLGLR